MIRRYYETVEDMKNLFINSKKELLLKITSEYIWMLNEDDKCDILFVINQIVDNEIDIAYNTYNRLDTFIRETIIKICEGSYK